MKLRDRVPFDAPAYVVAEAGVNHEGELETARRMVEAAAASGVQAIKFQTYTAGRLATRDSEAYWDTALEPSRSQYELFARYDSLTRDDYETLAADAAGHGLDFLTTVFDVDSVEWVEPLVPLFKVASADVTNHPLLRRIGETGKPVALSTGASTLEEVAEAVQLLEAAGCEVALLQCTLAYPTPPEHAAVGALVELRERFPGHALGYSDHTLPRDSHAAIAAAYCLGARIIEKHFTLDRTLPGNDHYHAFAPEDFARLVAELEHVRTLLGQPEKTVSPIEEAARRQARRSLVSARPIRQGEQLEEEMIDVKRPGTGIDPRRLADVVGRRAACDIAADVTLQWEMVEGGAQAGG